MVVFEVAEGIQQLLWMPSLFLWVNRHIFPLLFFFPPSCGNAENSFEQKKQAPNFNKERKPSNLWRVKEVWDGQCDFCSCHPSLSPCQESCWSRQSCRESMRFRDRQGPAKERSPFEGLPCHISRARGPQELFCPSNAVLKWKDNLSQQWRSVVPPSSNELKPGV